MTKNERKIRCAESRPNAKSKSLSVHGRRIARSIQATNTCGGAIGSASLSTSIPALPKNFHWLVRGIVLRQRQSAPSYRSRRKMNDVLIPIMNLQIRKPTKYIYASGIDRNGQTRIHRLSLPLGLPASTIFFSPLASAGK